MAMKDQQKNSSKRGNLKNLQGNSFRDKPERINKNGRPRKWVSTLKAQGYTIAEINDCIQVMLSMTQKELLEIHKKEKNATAMEVNIASAMLKDINKGEFKTAEILLSRRFGFPKQQMEHTGEVVTSYEIVAASEHKKETPGQ